VKVEKMVATRRGHAIEAFLPRSEKKLGFVSCVTIDFQVLAS
jgi:hypothetical protein